MDHYGISYEFRLAINIINLIFTVVFMIEAVLKIVAFGLWGYFSKKWNVFDFIVVITSIAEIIVGWVLGYPTFLNVLRTVRILRVFELIPVRHSSL